MWLFDQSCHKGRQTLLVLLLSMSENHVIGCADVVRVRT